MYSAGKNVLTAAVYFKGFLAGITREARLWLESHTLADFKETLTMNGGEHEKNNQD